MPATISRPDYAKRFGPTVGDRVRLADSLLFIQVERDLTIYGEEAVIGVGGVIRDGMGQGQTGWAEGAPDTVITNVVILDHSGIVKADVSIRDGVISAIGKAGNPGVQSGVTIPIGPGTEIIAGEGRILTAGGVDANADFIGPREIDAAIAAGITTMIGGGTGPGGRRLGAGSTPGAWHIGKMMDAADAFPMNLGFAGKGSASRPDALVEQIAGGACGLQLLEAWGATPTAIDCCLSVADAHDIQATLHAGALNEAGFFEETSAAFKGRTLVGFVSAEGGGVKLAGLANALPAWTRTGATNRTGDEPFERALAAEGILHDIGALSISSSQAAGGAGNIALRTWQIADRMKRRRGTLPDDSSGSDNLRARRYIAKYTINPAIACGISDHVGSVEIGKLADLVLWLPAFFGVKPEVVLKGGIIAAATCGESGAMFGAYAGACVGACLTFVSQLALDKGVGQRLRTQRRLVAVRNTRGGIGKQSMVLNDAMPNLSFEAGTGRIELNGELLTGEPLGEAPMAQRYSLF